MEGFCLGALIFVFYNWCSVARHILLLCFQNAAILLFHFHGGCHPKNLGYMGEGGGGAKQEKNLKKKGVERLSIKYHKLIIILWKLGMIQPLR